jgi:hypothetical protein
MRHLTPEVREGIVMMRLGFRFLTVAVAVVVALATMSGVGQAVVPPEEDPLIAAALARIADGTYTTADLDLVRRYPEIAETVPDPTREKMIVPN